jgi:lysozyme
MFCYRFSIIFLLKKVLNRKFSNRKTIRSKKSSSVLRNPNFYFLFFVSILGWILYNNREAVLYYFSFKSNKILHETRKVTLKKVLETHQEKVFGLDLSEYQNIIYWDKVSKIQSTFPIKFVLIRASVGNDKKDRLYTKYWSRAREQKFIVGAYHYYRPNENSIEQANNFIKNVKLKSGDFPPILDIEKLPKEQSIDSLKVGLHRWLDKIEAHYGVKPIIYSSESYYRDFLKDDFEDYPFWIANYTAFYEDIDSDWSIWQVTENGIIEGIKGRVDVNIFNGNLDDLNDLLID